MPSRAGGLAITRRADADLSGSQYRCVTFTISGGMALTGANGRAGGVLQDKPASGKLGAVQTDGLSRAVAGAAFAVGVPLKSDANGRVIESTGEAVGTLVEVVGYAAEPAAAAGDIVEINVNPQTIKR